MNALSRNHETAGHVNLWKIRFIHFHILGKILPFHTLQPRKERVRQEGESSLQEKRWKSKGQFESEVRGRQTIDFQSIPATLAGNIEKMTQLCKK